MLRILLMISVVVSVAGCLGGGSAPEQDGPELRKRHLVSGDQITVVGPEDYCIDTQGIRENDEGAFVPLGACASISGRVKDGAPKAQYLLSVVITPAPSALGMNGATLLPAAQQALRQDSLRAALADEKIGMHEVQDALIVTTRHSDTPDGLSQDQWRAVFSCRNHVVVLTVTGFERGQDMQDEQGEQVLLSFLSAMQSANPDGETGGKATGNTVRSLFGRLLN